jgi:hypothetical protein
MLNLLMVGLIMPKTTMGSHKSITNEKVKKYLFLLSIKLRVTCKRTHFITQIYFSYLYSHSLLTFDVIPYIFDLYLKINYYCFILYPYIQVDSLLNL